MADPVDLGAEFDGGRPGGLIRRRLLAIQHARLRRQAGAGADGDQILKGRVSLRNPMDGRVEIWCPSPQTAGNDEDVERRSAFEGVCWDDALEKGRILWVHAQASRLRGDRIKRRGDEGEVHLVRSRQSLQCIEGPKDVQRLESWEKKHSIALG